MDNFFNTPKQILEGNISAGVTKATTNIIKIFLLEGISLVIVSSILSSIIFSTVLYELNTIYTNLD